MSKKSKRTARSKHHTQREQRMSAKQAWQNAFAQFQQAKEKEPERMVKISPDVVHVDMSELVMPELVVSSMTSEFSKYLEMMQKSVQDQITVQMANTIMRNPEIDTERLAKLYGYVGLEESGADPDAVAVLCGQCKENYVSVKFTHGNVNTDGYSTRPCKVCAPPPKQEPFGVMEWPVPPLDGKTLVSTGSYAIRMTCGYCRNAQLDVHEPVRNIVDSLGFSTLPCHSCATRMLQGSDPIHKPVRTEGGSWVVYERGPRYEIKRFATTHEIEIINATGKLT